MNIFSNFIPNKIVTLIDQEPPWFVAKIKAKWSTGRSLLFTAKFEK